MKCSISYITLYDPKHVLNLHYVLFDNCKLQSVKGSNDDYQHEIIVKYENNYLK